MIKEAPQQSVETRSAKPLWTHFAVDRPITSRDEGTIAYVAEPQLEIVDALPSFSSPKREICTISGLKRTGRTSATYEYINRGINAGFEPLYHTALILTKEETALYEDGLRGVLETLIRDHLSKHGSLPTIIFDHADRLGEKGKLPHLSPQQLIACIDSVAKEQGITRAPSLIFVNDRENERTWIEKLPVAFPETKQLRTRLFTLEETKKIATFKDILQWDEDALDILYKVSGGNPGISQLICAELISEAKEAVSIHVTKLAVDKAVYKIVTNADIRGWHYAIIDYSIPAEAIIFLSRHFPEDRVSEWWKGMWWKKPIEEKHTYTISPDAISQEELPLVEQLASIGVLKETDAGYQLKIGLWGHILSHLGPSKRCRNSAQ